MLPNKPRGIPRVNYRRVLNGIFWVLRSGAPWRDLPQEFGPYTTCYKSLLSVAASWRCCRSFRIVRHSGHECPDAPHARALLRPRRERPCGCSAADERDELAALHSITSSARASSVGGTATGHPFDTCR